MDDLEQQLQQLRNLPETQRLLRERAQQARAMGQPSGRKFSTWGGALAGGLGDIFSALAGGMKERDAEEELKKATQAAEATRARVLQRSMEAQRRATLPPYGGQAGLQGVQNQPISNETPASGGVPPSSYPPSSSGDAPYYLERPQSLAGQMIQAYKPTPRERTQAVMAAQERQPREYAEMLASSDDPMLQRRGELQLQEIRNAQIQNQREREHAMERQLAEADYKRGRSDKLLDVDAERSYLSQEHALDRSSREKAAALEYVRQQQDATKRTAQEEEKARRGTNVPGMDIAPGAEPTPEDAKKVKQSKAAAERMGRYVKELRELHAKHGTEYGGEVGNRMQQLTEQIRLEGKNIADLGALSGPDMAIMERLSQADPGSFTANVKGLLGVDSTQSALTGLEKWVGNTLEGTGSAYGYVPKGGAAPTGGKKVVERRAAPDGRTLLRFEDGSLGVE